MKESKNKGMKKAHIGLLTILTMTILLYSRMQIVQAAVDTGTREQAIAAYYNLLTQDKISWGDEKARTNTMSYSIIDLNGDKLPELVLATIDVDEDNGNYRIYTFTDGKAKSLGKFMCMDIFCRNKNFFVNAEFKKDVTKCTYYRLKNGKRVSLLTYTHSNTKPKGKKNVTKINGEYGPVYYYDCKVNGETTTYKKCMSRMYELESGAEYLELNFQDNVFTNHGISYKDSISEYSGNTFYTGYTYMDEGYPNVYRVSESGTRKMLQYDAHIQKRRKQYLFTENNYGDFGVSNLYVVNGSTGKIKLLTSKSNGTVTTTDKYAYYPVFSKYETESVKFKIYRCKLSGSSKKARTDTISAKKIIKVTSSYVQYQKNSTQYRYYYESGKVKKVDTVNPSVKISGGSTGGNTCTFNVTTVPSSASVKWSSSNTSVATVNNGKVTAKGAGTAKIKASITYNNKTYSASKTITVATNRTYGAWSNWTMNSISSSSTKEVRTTKLYRYYYYYCPKCGGREPFTGTSDCHKYTLSASDWHEGWSTISYANCSPKSYSYTTAKKYTESLGDGKRWNFSAGNLNDTAVGTKDAGSSAVVIKTGYSSRSINTSYVISKID